MAGDEGTGPVAAVLLVFGRGVVAAGERGDRTVGAGQRYDLTPGSLARVEAADRYVRAHPGAVERIILSGGWGEACAGDAEPPAGCREGDLMVRAARAAGLDRQAELRAESRSRSTLENLLHTAGDGLLDGYDFTAQRPLGIVSHGWHLPRIRFLAGKVLGLRGPHLLDVPALGGEIPTGWSSERVARLAARVWLAGARPGPAMIRRERRVVTLLRSTERLRRAGRSGRRTSE